MSGTKEQIAVKPDARQVDVNKPLLEVRNLAVSFSNPSSPTSPRVQAVAGVNMTIYPRQTLAVVGESGCGKSVTALSVMQSMAS